MKSTVIINQESFQLESWVREDFNRDEFVLAFQIFNGNKNRQPQSMRLRINRDFVDDDIKNGATVDDMESINHRMLEQHIEAIINGHANSLTTIQRWLVEAKT